MNNQGSGMFLTALLMYLQDTVGSVFTSVSGNRRESVVCKFACIITMGEVDVPNLTQAMVAAEPAVARLLNQFEEYLWDLNQRRGTGVLYLLSDPDPNEERIEVVLVEGPEADVSFEHPNGNFRASDWV